MCNLQAGMDTQAEELMTVKNIKPTAMRLLVLEYLLKQTTATSLQDLETEFKHADRITLYRTLKTFEEKKLVHAINDHSGSVKYALCETSCKGDTHTDLHLHFYCTSCQDTLCLPRTKIPAVNLPENFQLEELNLIAKGMCDKCINIQN
jgi:Fur family ferric uptake transcriptional regulator